MSNFSNDRLIDLLNTVNTNDPNNQFLDKIYKRHNKHTPIEVVAEICNDGSNTIGRIATNSVDYDEVVRRVAKKLGVKKDDITDDEIKNELMILQIIVKKYLKKFPDKRVEIENKLTELVNNSSEATTLIPLILDGTSKAFIGSLLCGTTANAFLLEEILYAALLPMMSVTAASRASTLFLSSIPYLNLIFGVWLIASLTGPAYRKIIPTVIDIALLRLQSNVLASTRK